MQQLPQVFLRVTRIENGYLAANFSGWGWGNMLSIAATSALVAFFCFGIAIGLWGSVFYWGQGNGLWVCVFVSLAAFSTYASWRGLRAMAVAIRWIPKTVELTIDSDAGYFLRVVSGGSVTEQSGPLEEVGEPYIETVVEDKDFTFYKVSLSLALVNPRTISIGMFCDRKEATDFIEHMNAAVLKSNK